MQRSRSVLRLHRLELRLTPASFTVVNTNDAGPGSFRQAVLNANGNPGADHIQFQTGLQGPIILTSSQVTITDPVTINGPDAVFAGTMVIGGNYARRVLVVNADTTITGLGLSAGVASAAPAIGFGGGVYSTANLTLIACGLGGDTATNGGGAIYHTGPNLTLIGCQLSGNFAGNSTAAKGGAILASGTVMLKSCYFQQNSAVGVNSAGGAVCLTSGTLTMENCGFQTNGTGSFGTGGAVQSAGPVTAINCTFDNNGATGGGGLYLTAGGTLWNCTIAFNGFSGGGGQGGGVHGDVSLESTIISNNVSGTGPAVFGAVTAKNSALDSSAGISSYTDKGGNLPIGTNVQFSRTISGTYGGGLLTVPLAHTSPCKDKGSNPSGALYDERGPGFPRVVGAAADIGAFEIQPPPKPTLFIGDGVDPQRSQVTQMYVVIENREFSTTGGILPATQLKRLSDNATVTLALGGTAPPDTNTTKTYTFHFKGGPLDGTSLADGVYQLRITASKITDVSNQNLDGNGDGVGGDDYVSPTTGPGRIHRLFGDVDGSGSVDVVDFGAFRGAFGNGSNLAFDFDGDGDVDAADYGQFRQRFGTSV